MSLLSSLGNFHECSLEKTKLQIKCILATNFKCDEKDQQKQYHADDLARIYALHHAVKYTVKDLGCLIKGQPDTEEAPISKRVLLTLLAVPVEPLSPNESDDEESGPCQFNECTAGLVDTEFDKSPQWFEHESEERTFGLEMHSKIANLPGLKDNLGAIYGLHGMGLSLYDLRVYLSSNPKTSQRTSSHLNHDTSQFSPDGDPTYCNPQIWSETAGSERGFELRRHVKDMAEQKWPIKKDKSQQPNISLAYLEVSQGRILAIPKCWGERFVTHMHPVHKMQDAYLKITLPNQWKAYDEARRERQRENKYRKRGVEKSQIQPELTFFNFFYERPNTFQIIDDS